MADLKEVYGDYFNDDLYDIRNRIKDKLQKMYVKNDFIKYSKKFAEFCVYVNKEIVQNEKERFNDFEDYKMYYLPIGKVMTVEEIDITKKEDELIKELKILEKDVCKLNEKIEIKISKMGLEKKLKKKLGMENKLIILIDDNEYDYAVIKESEQEGLEELEGVQIVDELEIITPDEPFPPVNKYEKSANFNY